MEKCALTGPRPVSGHARPSLTASARTRGHRTNVRVAWQCRDAQTYRNRASCVLRFAREHQHRHDRALTTRRPPIRQRQPVRHLPRGVGRPRPRQRRATPPATATTPGPHRAADLLRELFETDCDVYFAFNGTAANSLALASLGQSYHAVVCHETAHVETYECGAPEFFSNGMKLLTCPGADGQDRPGG